MASALRVVRQLAGLKAAQPFLAPVNESLAPGYHDVIKQPMDLGTVQQQLGSQAYASPGKASNISVTCSRGHQLYTLECMLAAASQCCRLM